MCYHPDCARVLQRSATAIKNKQCLCSLRQSLLACKTHSRINRLSADSFSVVYISYVFPFLGYGIDASDIFLPPSI